MRLALTALFAMALAACDARTADSIPAADDRSDPPQVELLTEEKLVEYRLAKDEQYRTSADSPIPASKRASFRSLSYYAFAPSVQFLVRLERDSEREPVTLITTTGEKRPATRAGWVEFELEGTTNRLNVYELRDVTAREWGSLFLPFSDETTGVDTYGAGRYVELAGGEDDWYVLDFNLAYYPLCAYGRSGYRCPRTPAENRLPFPVRAGERGGLGHETAEPARLISAAETN